MWRLSRTDTFVRTARRLVKRDPQLAQPLASALKMLAEDPRNPRLRLHRLKGPLKGLWSVRVTFSIRLVITLDSEDEHITLLDVGAHDEVYR
ncbi:MAG: type II toxin-antitoxin system YafQ family toxin [Thermoanaerobaculales bacterium]